MAASESTCWLLIRGAAAGRVRDRDDFARCYEPVIRAFLAARWRDAAQRGELDDAVQEVFIECFRCGGALETADPERPQGFRAFLSGVTRNVALRFERARGRSRERTAGSVSGHGGDIDRDPSVSLALDRAWALARLRKAGLVMAAHAERLDREGRGGHGAVRRVELLELTVPLDPARILRAVVIEPAGMVAAHSPVALVNLFSIVGVRAGER